MRTPENYTPELQLFNNLYHRLSTGGFSINVNDEEPTEGYLVGTINGPTFDALESVRSKDVIDFISQYSDELYHHPKAYLGGWVDEDTGEVHIDISYAYTRLESAIETARRHGELAIYDAKEKKAIRV